MVVAQAAMARPTNRSRGIVLMGDLIDPARRPARAAENGARSAERARLAATIEELAAAMAELTAAQEPASRLAAIIAAASRGKSELAEVNAADEERLGAWLAAGGGEPRPARSPAAITVEERHAELAGDAAAARIALPAAEAVFQRCAARVRDVQRRRDEAVCAAAIDAARDFAEGYRAALIAALEEEAVLHGLREELLRCGNRADALPGALEAAAHIGEVIVATKRTASVRRDPDGGRRLLAALVSDPDARLQKDAIG
jgi:hypothetical protein